ncbi:MAG TPA: diguanylate cyclase [bacterium]|nr:diguanylate cyclase [bacterium]HPN43614.1 diguanylate cyclase [bacterium]
MPKQIVKNNVTKKAHLLIVDDTLANISVLRSFLATDYELTIANSGAAAIELIEKEKPDLILLDVMMPGMNGYDTCQIIKNNVINFYIPIILVTALNEVEDKIKGIESGADDFITKPVNKHELLARVKSLLRIKYLHDQLQEKVKQLEETKEILRELATKDGLTDIYNYRYFKDTLSKEIERARRNKSQFTLIMFDIDFFKNYNDTYGHLAGDEVLRTIAGLIKRNIRSIDTAARYGGEEFALIFPETDKMAGKIVANKLKDLVDNYRFNLDNARPNGKISISVGVSTFPHNGTTSEELIECADRRLYIAKANGKNQVIDEG